MMRDFSSNLAWLREAMLHLAAVPVREPPLAYASCMHGGASMGASVLWVPHWKAITTNDSNCSGGRIHWCRIWLHIWEHTLLHEVLVEAKFSGHLSSG